MMMMMKQFFFGFGCSILFSFIDEKIEKKRLECLLNIYLMSFLIFVSICLIPPQPYIYINKLLTLICFEISTFT